ncbi:hypothetical protein LUZ63_009215 [Rhynchospora breviuscula]|uniref:Pentatricopeptide repeat-containing protein n=1 Tax=Rhynchospora breviuscula TaxID=2022672 RepID=A0A9Q0HNC7_9POAL|nr:hypothetical protein LUZ63_009215 [Rhynchospora breviuscula]
MYRYLKSVSMPNWSIGFLKVSHFLEKIQQKNKSSSRFFSAVAVLRQNLDYSSGDDTENFVLFPPQKICPLDSTQVCNNLHNLKTNPSGAFAYFKDCENLGFRHGIPTYTAIISILFSSNQPQNLVSLFCKIIPLSHRFSLSLFNSLRQSGGGPGLVSFALDALLEAYITSKRARPQEAAHVFFELANLGFLPTLRACNLLLSFVAATGKERTLISVMEQMLTLGIKPDAYSFEILCNFFLDAKQPRELTLVDFNKAICLFCKGGRLEEVGKLIEAMDNKGIEPNSSSYGPFIKAFCDRGYIQRAWDLYGEMTVRGLKTSPPIAAHFLLGYDKLGKNDEVLLCFKKFKKLGVVPDRVLYNFALNALGRLRFTEKAMDLIQEMKRNGLEPDRNHYTCLMRGFRDRGDAANAQVVFVEMLNLGLKPDTVTYNILISGFFDSGLIGKAIVLLGQMIVRAIGFNVNTHGLIIKVFCKGVSRKCAYDYFLRFSKQGYPISKLPHEWLVGQLCDQGKVMLAEDVFLQLWKHRVLPHLHSYGKLIKAFCQNGDMSKARFWFDNMHNHGIGADSVIYTTLMDGYFKAGKSCYALKVFEEMKDAGIKPDGVTYTVILDGLYKMGSETCLSEMTREKRKFEIKDKVSELVRRMKKEEIEPDLVAYTVFIYGQCKWGSLNGAQKFFDKMLEKGLEPDVKAYTLLIKGYSRRGQVEKVRELSHKMVDSGIMPD